jgi:hypothetical protein
MIIYVGPFKDNISGNLSDYSRQNDRYHDQKNINNDTKFDPFERS